MSSLSLARKYRPRRFLDMVGQEPVTLALTNAIRLRREPRSVIFTGVRGVGKTTTARIYAKALNCEQGPTADPCDVCSSCLAIQAGTHEDVLEIDGASNTGVDDVRALQETLGYIPQRSGYKIYIIDEVHMLSISAFNALLKTLEEPPEHVVFIFATTELHKVPETIQSRCQTFHLQKISRGLITSRLESILRAENVPFDSHAVSIVAREGRGSLRDALTLLDQVIALGAGHVDAEALRQALGGSRSQSVRDLLVALVDRQAKPAIEAIAAWDQEGLAMSSLVEEFAKACRNAFILRELKGEALDLRILDLEDKEQENLLEIASQAAPFDLNRLFRTFTKCLDDLKHADLDRYVVENYALEWCLDPGLPDLQSLGIGSGPGGEGRTPAPPPQRPVSGAETGVGLKERLKSQTVPPSSGAGGQEARVAPMPVASEAKNLGATLKESWKASASVRRADPPPSGAALAQVTMRVDEGLELNARAGESAPKGARETTAAPLAEKTRSSLSLDAAPKVSSASNSQPKAEGAAAAAGPNLPSSNTPEGLSPAAALDFAAMQLVASPRRETQGGAPLRDSPKPSPSSPRLGNTSQRTSVDGEGAVGAPSAGGVSSADLVDEAGAIRTARSSGTEDRPVAMMLDRTEDASKERTEAAPKERTEAAPKERTEAAPKERTEAAPKERTEAAPKERTEAAPKERTEAAPKERTEAAPKERTEAAPKERTEAAPKDGAETLAAGSRFPASWRDLVDEWKKQKPLQARVLEEAYVLVYSPERIRLAVEQESMAGSQLLQPDLRKRFLAQFAELFDFRGQLEVLSTVDAKSSKPDASTDLGESLLTARQRERELARHKLRQDLEEHPLTREVMAIFGGTIETIELT